MIGSYRALEQKYGPGGAYQCLVEIEKAARIHSWKVAEMDYETRLANAIRVQDAANDNKNLETFIRID